MVQNVFRDESCHLSVEYCAKSWVQDVQAVLPDVNRTLQDFSLELTWTKT